MQALTLASPDVKSTFDQNGINGYAGAVAGRNQGAIENCHVKGGSVTGENNVTAGGVVGWNTGTVTGCSSSAEVTGSNEAGGVVGVNQYGGTVTGCYSTGNVTATVDAGGVVGTNTDPGSTVTACYFTGAVNGATAGGVAGYNGDIITTCYWSGTVNGSYASDQGIGENDGTGDATKVDGSTTWETAVEAMNTALEKKNSDWRYTFTGSLPTLTKN